MKILWTLLLLGVVLSTRSIFAFCGGTVIKNPDCDSNPRPFAISCCPEGYQVHGIGYNDFKNKDKTDAFSAVCYRPGKALQLVPSDFKTDPIFFICDEKEELVGLECKDLPKDKDFLDGCRISCKSLKTGEIRQVYNEDLRKNRRSFVKIYAPSNQKIVGIGYKDIRKGRLNKKQPDTADCVSLSVR